jgi:hypothetical protein
MTKTAPVGEGNGGDIAFVECDLRCSIGGGRDGGGKGGGRGNSGWGGGVGPPPPRTFGPYLRVTTKPERRGEAPPPFQRTMQFAKVDILSLPPPPPSPRQQQWQGRGQRAGGPMVAEDNKGGSWRSL